MVGTSNLGSWNGHWLYKGDSWPAKRERSGSITRTSRRDVTVFLLGESSDRVAEVFSLGIWFFYPQTVYDSMVQFPKFWGYHPKVIHRNSWIFHRKITIQRDIPDIFMPGASDEHNETAEIGRAPPDFGVDQREKGQVFSWPKIADLRGPQFGIAFSWFIYNYNFTSLGLW